MKANSPSENSLSETKAAQGRILAEKQAKKGHMKFMANKNVLAYRPKHIVAG